MRFEELLKQGKESMENEQKKWLCDFFAEVKTLVEKIPILDSCSVAYIDFFKRKAILADSKQLYSMIYDDVNFLDKNGWSLSMAMFGKRFSKYELDFSERDVNNIFDIFFVEKVIIAFSENPKVFIRISTQVDDDTHTSPNGLIFYKYFDEQLKTFSGYEGIVQNSYSCCNKSLFKNSDRTNHETVTVKFDLSFFKR